MFNQQSSVLVCSRNEVDAVVAAWYQQQRLLMAQQAANGQQVQDPDIVWHQHQQRM